MAVVKRLVIIVLFTSLISCQCVGETPPRDYYAQLLYSNDTISACQFNIMPDSKYVLKDTIDLQAKTLVLPKGVTICKKKGGLIRNGRLIGNNTKVNSCSVIFDKVKIEGSWIVPQISTSLFADLNYNNSLKDVIALSSPQINNKIYIESGDYQGSVSKTGDAVLSLNSNTDVIINGNIRLIPNVFPSYSIIRADGNNIKIHGKGSLYGDKQTHIGKDGEWGMGIFISGGNVSVKDISVNDCWGDCIYIRTRSKKILIDNCALSNGRRQGISITSARDVTIKNCVISNIFGTSPEYAIDVEPNKGDSIGKVIIDKVKAINCKGGICSYGKAAMSKTEYISITNSLIKNSEKTPISFNECDEVIVRNCRIDNCKGSTAIALIKIKKGSVSRNLFTMKSNNISEIINPSKHKYIEVTNCRYIDVKE